jgi:predicted dehydrogenase
MKAGLLGWGNPHALEHLRTLQTLPEIDGVLVWGDNERALTSLSGEPKVEAIYTDLDLLLAREDYYFVIATLRTDTLPATILRVLAAGKHALVEKPLGRTAAEVEPIVLAAERAGLQLGVCYARRFHPAVQEARRLIAEGVLGRLVSVEMRMLTTQLKYRIPTHWLQQKAVSGGGIVAWLGCHDLDMLRFLTGDEVVSVSAETATLGDEGVDVEDMASLALRLQSGAIGSLQAGYTLALPGGGPLGRPTYDTYHAFNGRSGRLELNPTATPAILKVESAMAAWEGAPMRQTEIAIAPSPAYGNVYGEAFVRAFILACQGEGSCPASGRDALQVARIVDAAYESSRRGCRVSVPLP